MGNKGTKGLPRPRQKDPAAADAPPRKGSGERLRRRPAGGAQRQAAVKEVLGDLGLSTLSGVMVFTSFPRYDLYPLLWFSIVPLLFVVEKKSPWRAFGWGFWAGLVTNWGGFWWVTGMLMDFGHFSLTLSIPICTILCAYQGLVFAIWAGLTRWLSVRTGANLLWVAPVVWVVVEYALPFIFPWYMANGQYLFYPAIQVTELTGVLGLSFLVLFVNVGLYMGAREALMGRWSRAWRPVVLALSLFALNTLYGIVRMHQVDALMESATKLRIGLGEANVGIFEKEARNLTSVTERLGMLRGNILKHQLLAAELEKEHRVDLIVEPESSFIPVPYPYGTVGFKRSDLFAVAGGAGRDVWELRDERWSGPRRTAQGVASINAIAAGREEHVFAVGPEGVVLRMDGDQWVREEAGTKEDLHGVWVGEISSDDRLVDGVPSMVWAVGAGGAALLRDGRGWTKTEPLTQAVLRAVAATGGNNAWAVGDGGTVRHFNGLGWEKVQAGTTVNLSGVWISPLDGDVVAVGDHGTVLTRHGEKWASHTLGTAHLRAIAGDRRGPIVVANGGRSFWRQQGRWRSLSTPVATDLLSVAVDGRGNAWAVGGGGTMLSLPPGADRWSQNPSPRGAGTIRAVAGVPYTLGHVYARDSRYLYRARTDLPDLQGRKRMDWVRDPDQLMAADSATPLADWNSPMRGFDTPILLGLLTYEPRDQGVSALAGREHRRIYNSAMLLDTDGRVLGRYDKNYLLVFGEYIPLGDVFPQLYEWLPEASHFEAGETVETFPFRGHQIGVMICYEDIIPRFTRRLAGKDPNVLVNVTNDAWFGKTSEPYLHLALSVFRSVENRLWLIRSTNTGVSVFVDAVGRIVSQTSLEDPEILVEDVPMLRTSTPYRSYGDIFAYLCVVAFAVLAVVALARGRREKRARAD